MRELYYVGYLLRGGRKNRVDFDDLCQQLFNIYDSGIEGNESYAWDMHMIYDPEEGDRIWYAVDTITSLS